MLFNTPFEPIFLGALLIVILVLQHLYKTLAIQKWLSLGLLVLCLIFAGRFFQIVQMQPYHVHDLYHYVIGGKYFKYLGYDGLYAATAQALTEQQFDLTDINIRNLAQQTESISPDWQTQAQRVKAAMPAPVWTEFSADIAYFSSEFGYSRQAWQLALNDYGFNPAPFWSLQAAPILHAAPLPQLVPWLIYIDYLLIIAIGFILLTLTRQWSIRAGILAIYWFVLTYYPSFGLQAYLYTTGAFLRYTWFFYLSVGMVLLLKQRFYLAGFVLALAGLERIFPFAFIGVAGLWLIWQSGGQLWRSLTCWAQLKTLAITRFSLGVLTSFCLVLILSSVFYSANSLLFFAQHIQTHQNLAGNNSVGFKQLITGSDKHAGYRLWYLDHADMTEMQTENLFAHRSELLYKILAQRYQQNYVAWVLLIITLIFISIIAISRLPLTLAVWSLGSALIFFLTFMSYYYHVFLAPYAAFLWYFSQQQQRAVAHFIYFSAFCLVLTSLSWHVTKISDISFAISIGLWFFLPLAIASYHLAWRQQLVLALSLVLGFGLILYQDGRSYPAILPPNTQQQLQYQLGDEALHKLLPETKRIQLTYLDENARLIEETGAIMTKAHRLKFNVSLIKPETKPLQFIMRSDFNYPVTLSFKVNQHLITTKAYPSMGGLFLYKTIDIPSKLLRNGYNTFELQVVEGKAFALFHLWLVY